MKEKIKKILRWLHWHAPIITTRKKIEDFVDDSVIERCREIERLEIIYKAKEINFIISSLQELRKNTWDVERVDRTINWLKNKFWRE